MLTLLKLAKESVEATQDDPEGSALTVNEILRLLDVSGTHNVHLENPLNHPRNGYLKPRAEPFSGDEPVHGKFLVLIYCAHDPFVRLDDHKDIASLNESLASLGGVVNPFITYGVAFIDGKVAPYRIAYRKEDGSVGWFDKHLQNTIGPQEAERAKERWVVWSDTQPFDPADRPQAGAR